MDKLLRVLRWVMAVVTIVLVAALCWQVVDIYLLGSSAANRTDAGVPLQPIFRWDDVSTRLASLQPLFWGYGALCVLALFLHAFRGQTQFSVAPRHSAGQNGHLRAQKASSSSLTKQYAAESIRSRKPVQRARIALYALAIIMMVWGVMNGGLRDVLVKAINICTECIGLG